MPAPKKLYVEYNELTKDGVKSEIQEIEVESIKDAFNSAASRGSGLKIFFAAPGDFPGQERNIPEGAREYLSYLPGNIFFVADSGDILSREGLTFFVVRRYGTKDFSSPNMQEALMRWGIGIGLDRADAGNLKTLGDFVRAVRSKPKAAHFVAVNGGWAEIGPGDVVFSILTEEKLWPKPLGKTAKQGLNA